MRRRNNGRNSRSKVEPHTVAEEAINFLFFFERETEKDGESKAEQPLGGGGSRAESLGEAEQPLGGQEARSSSRMGSRIGGSGR